MVDNVKGLACYGRFFFKQKTAYEMRISDWSSDVCSSDLINDYAGLDLKGKVAVALSGSPVGMPSEIGAHLAAEKSLAAQQAGAKIGRASCRESLCQYV